MHANLYVEHLIYYMGTVIVDSSISLQDSDGEVIPVSEMDDLPKIDNITDKAISELVGNAACGLALF